MTNKSKILFLFFGFFILVSITITLVKLINLTTKHNICTPKCNNSNLCKYNDGCGGTCTNTCSSGQTCNKDGKCEYLYYKFRPILYFNSAEKFFPSSIEYILENSTLTRGSDKTILLGLGKINTTNIGEFNDKYDKDSNPSSNPPRSGYNLRINDIEDIHYGDNSFRTTTTKKNLVNDVPIYVNTHNIDDSTLLIQYIFVYPYNGSQRILGRNYGMHPGDIEHISVLVDKNKEKIIKIFFGAHKTGVDGQDMKVDDKNLQFIGDRPVVYIARSSHATYPYHKKGGWPVKSANKIYNDMVDDGGVHWYTEKIVVIDDKTPWNTFRGNIGGSGGPRAPLYQGWWNKYK